MLRYRFWLQQEDDEPATAAHINYDKHGEPSEYFRPNWRVGDPEDGQVPVGRPQQLAKKARSFRANLWLCDDYPLSLREQLLPIIDMMAPSNAHFAKLHDFISLRLPSGFPVKIGKAPTHISLLE